MSKTPPKKNTQQSVNVAMQHLLDSWNHTLAKEIWQILASKLCTVWFCLGLGGLDLQHWLITSYGIMLAHITV